MRAAVCLSLGACAAIVATAAAASAVWAVLSLVPGVNVVAIPSLIGSVLLLVHTLPFATYLLLAQTDAPKHRGNLFLPFSPARHLGILVAVSSYLRTVLAVLLTFVAAATRTAWRLWKTPPPVADDETTNAPQVVPGGWWWERFASFGISYQPPNSTRRHRPHKLDVYRAQAADRKSLSTSSLTPDSSSPPGTPGSCSSVATLPDVDQGSRADLHDFPHAIWSDQPPGSPIESEDGDLRPVIVFLYDVGTMGPFKPRRWMFALTGLLLAQQGYTVVVPDVTTYPDGQMEESVTDVRAVLAWVHKEIRAYGGDPSKIFVCGHGLGAHLGMYTIAQDVVVHSRDKVELRNVAANWAGMGYATDPTGPREIPNGVRSLRIYGSDIELPPIRGVILLSPVADVIKQVRHESRCWLEHVSPLRRSLGSSQTRCMRHSCGHILFAAKNIVDAELLPRGALILHGKRDQLVPEWQGAWLAELLKGFDFDVTMRTYSRLAHFDMVTNLMAGLDSRTSEFLLQEIRSFVDGYH